MGIPTTFTICGGGSGGFHYDEAFGNGADISLARRGLHGRLAYRPLIASGGRELGRQEGVRYDYGRAASQGWCPIFKSHHGFIHRVHRAHREDS